MGELGEEERALRGLPEWARLYFAAWGSTRPDGKRMTVTWAAWQAGVTDAAVREWRAKSKTFRIWEHLARFGSSEFMASYAQAGLRGMAGLIMQAFEQLVQEGNPQVVTQGMKWLLDRPDEVDVNLRGAVAGGRPGEWAELGDDDLERIISNLEAAVGRGAAGAAAEDEPGEPGSPGLDNPEALDVSARQVVRLEAAPVPGGDLQHPRAEDGDLQGEPDGRE